jgi:hypothetical protein
MTNTPLSATKQALLTIQKLQARIDQLEGAQSEAIAIVGIGCRFPGGAGDPESYWDMLRAGTDAVGEVPAARWSADAYYHADPDVPGKTYTTRGGFLPEVDTFDPQFFGIAPREAVQLDPQQRLLLEVVCAGPERPLYGVGYGVLIVVTGRAFGLSESAPRRML